MKTSFISTLFFLLFSGVTAFGQTFDDLTFGTDSTLDVITWNIEWFPKNGQTTINYVTDIIAALEADVVAIQEVDDINAFEQVIANLSTYEGYLESSYFAGLAYIYNPATVQINDIYEIYTTSPYWSPFPRSPMVMDFNYRGNRVIVINNHYKCCGDGILDPYDDDDEETRRYIASELLKEYIETYFPEENVIVLGDLNDELTDTPQNNVFQLFLDDSANFQFADYAIATGPSSDWSYPSWPSHLDHMLITNELFDEFENDVSLLSTIKIEEHLSGGWWQYDEYISDHRPVALKLQMEDYTDADNLLSTTTSFSNYPNPFSATTTFSIGVSHKRKSIEIVNMMGQTIFSEQLPANISTFTWRAPTLPNGIYLATLKSENAVLATLKLMVRN